MPQPGGKESPLRQSLREEFMAGHFVPIPKSRHIVHESCLRLLQTARSRHLPRAAILALILMALTGALVARLTFAYFSDTATTTATFSTGTVGLEVCLLDDVCNEEVDLPELLHIYPGWSYTTTGLQLHNQGSLAMTVSITGAETSDGGLAQAIGVQVYRASSPTDPPIFSGTFESLNSSDPNSSDPIVYGLLAADAYDDITFVFTWPETGEDQTGLSGKSLNEVITLYGTTQVVE